MKSRLIINPTSGTNSGPDVLQSINQRLRSALGDLDIVMTVGPGDAGRAGRQAALDGYERVFVGGGDGTLNEVMNGVAGVDGGLKRIVFGLVPLGTGNDFANALGLSEDIEASMTTLLEERIVDVDVGVVNDRHFINVSAGGFIADVSNAVSSEMKSLAGKLAYLIGGMQVLMEFEPARMHFRASGKGVSAARELSVHMFAVCNSRMVGGGRLIAPQALIDDGQLDVCVVQSMPMLDFIGLLTRAADGEHIEDERVLYFRADEIDLSFDRPLHVNTDGEVLEWQACKYRVMPKAARFLAGATPFSIG